MFLKTHVMFLKGHISAASNITAAVSWPGFYDRVSPFDSSRTGGPNRGGPKDPKTCDRIRAAFSPLEPADGEEDTAVVRHKALQLVIKAAPAAPTKEALRRKLAFCERVPFPHRTAMRPRPPLPSFETTRRKPDK
jgi:hypothetical protein